MADTLIAIYYSVVFFACIWFAITHILTKSHLGPYISALLWFLVAGQIFGWMLEALERIVDHG